MKKIVHTLACIAALLISQSSIADPYYNWAKRLGDAGANVDVGKAIYSDQNGNVYLTGYFKGAVDFDPSNGVSLLTAGGTAENIFFAKYTANGKLSWAKQIGDANKSVGLAIQTDDTGNVYLLSNFELSLSIDYDPGTGTSNMSGQGFKTIVLSKYTSNGDYVWAKSINGNADNYAHSMRLDEAGNIFIAGRFDGITDFDPSAAAATLTSIGAYNGFFAKYTNQGNYMWANQLSGVISGEIDVNDLTLDNLGNLYLSGNYKTSCDFDPSPATTIRSNDGNSDFYVGKYTENGVLLWAIALDGTNDDYARSIAVDANYNVYVAGTFMDSLDTDPSAIDHFVVSSAPGNQDYFVAQYNSLGGMNWAFGVGNGQVATCNSLKIDGNNTVYLTGSFSGTMDFDPSVNTAIQSAVAGYDIYLAVYDSYGEYVWAKNIGGNSNDEGLDMFLDEYARIYMTGYFGDAVDFDISSDTVELSGGLVDIFMLKYSQDLPIVLEQPFDKATWLVGASYPISWSSSGIDSVKIERLESGQSNWELLGVESATASPFTYNLLITNPLTEYKLRVSDADNKTVKYTNEIRVKFNPQFNYPLGNEQLAGDSIITVKWIAVGSSAPYFDLKYSLNGGANWFVMRDSVQTFFDTDSSFYIGNYNWKIPSNSPTNNAKIGIFPVNQTIPLLASNSFTLLAANPTSFTLLSPNGGETLERKRHHFITWTGVSMPPIVVLSYTLDGLIYSTIDTIANVGYYDWRVRDTVSNNCFIKISNLLGSITDESDAAFEIVNSAGDEAELLAPQLNDLWCAGTKQYIRWTTNVSTKIVLEYTTGSGGWNLIDTVDAANNMYFWTIPSVVTNAARVRVSPADGSGSNLSTTDKFTICANAASVELLSPNGGNAYFPGCYITIDWLSNKINSVSLLYTIDDGIHWNVIDSNLVQNTYCWLVPDSTSTQCKVKVAATFASNVVDESDAVFEIKSLFVGTAPSLLTSNLSITPCVNDTFSVAYTVSGDIFDTSNVFLVQLSDSSGNFSGAITVIGSLKDSVSNSIACVIPSGIKNSALYQIRVVANNPPVIGIASSAFAIDQPEFNFTDTTIYRYLPSASVAFPFIGNLPVGSSVEWEFGDGSTSSALQPTYSYSQPGIFDVSVKVTNSAGCSSKQTYKNYVRVDKKFPNRKLDPNNTNTITGISFRNDSTGTIAFSDGAVKFTNDYGTNWYSVQPSGIQDVKAVKVKSSTEWIVVGGNGGVRKTLNRGLSWDTVTFAGNITPNVRLNAVDFSTTLSGYIAGDSGKVFRFFNGKFNPAPQFTQANLYTVYDDGSTAFVAGDSGKIVKRSAGIWTHKNSGLTAAIRCIVFAPSASAKGYAVSDEGKIIQSTDNGDTWSLSLSGVDIDFSSVACSEAGDSVWAVGTNGIIYQSLDNGGSWERFSIGTTNNTTNVKVKKDKGYLSGSSGTLRTFNPVNNQLSVGIKWIAASTNSTTLLYPNPSNSHFLFSINSPREAHLKVYLKDINGKDISMLCNKMVTGNYSQLVDVSALKSGIYFVHFTSDNSITIKKIVIAH